MHYSHNTGMILWISESLVISTSLMALVIVATSTGGVLVPPLVGQLFERYSPMWTVYLVLIFAVLDFIIFIALLLMRSRRMHPLQTKPIIALIYNSVQLIPPTDQ